MSFIGLETFNVKLFPENTLLWHFENVSIKFPKHFLYYIEFICRRACEKINK